MPRLVALVSALFALTALAQPRIAVLPFSGPGNAAARKQLVGRLCDEATCVPAAKVGNSPKPNWKKLKKEKVTYAVTGKVTKKGKKSTLALQVLKAGKPKLKKSYPLDSKGKLSGGDLGKATAAVSKAVGAGGAPAESPPEPPAEETPPPERSEPVAEATKPEPSRTEEPAPPPPTYPDESGSSTSSSSSTSSEVVTTPEEPRKKRKDPLIIGEVGPDLYTRRFAYSGEVQTRNLRSYSANLIVAPRLKVEFYPLASSSRGLPAGIGLEAAYAFAVGLKSGPRDRPEYPTSATRLDVGAKVRVKPFTGNTAIVPGVGFRNSSFAVGASADGTRLDGLPAISYSALVLSLGADIEALDGKLWPFVRAAYLPVLSSGEIVSPAYFANGSASGIEVTAGAGYRVTPQVEVRLTGLFTRYGLTFTTQPGDAYIAPGASDLYAGANLSARFLY